MTLEQVNELAKNNELQGIYEIDSSVYFMSPAISNSGLSLIARSPACFDYWRNMDLKKEPTAAQRFGTYVHAAILEPDQFDKNYVSDNLWRVSGLDRRSKDGKKLWDEFKMACGTKEIIEDELYETIIQVRNSVLGHPILAPMLRSGYAEHAVYWTDKETGILCKCKPDFLTTNNIIIDLKTTEDARKEQFEKSAFTYRYHSQAAFYIEGVSNALKRQVENFLFVAIEKKPPYSVGIYRADEIMVEAGNKAFRRDLNLYAKCMKENKWDGLPQEIIDMSIPPWAMSIWSEL